MKQSIEKQILNFLIAFSYAMEKTSKNLFYTQFLDAYLKCVEEPTSEVIKSVTSLYNNCKVVYNVPIPALFKFWENHERRRNNPENVMTFWGDFSGPSRKKDNVNIYQVRFYDNLMKIGSLYKKIELSDVDSQAIIRMMESTIIDCERNLTGENSGNLRACIDALSHLDVIPSDHFMFRQYLRRSISIEYDFSYNYEHSNWMSPEQIPVQQMI